MPPKEDVALLKKKFKTALNSYGIKRKDKRKINAALEMLEEKSLKHYIHSLRVALLAPQIASLLKLDEKALFFAGALHDIGKIMIPKKILQKTTGLSPKEKEIMAMHPIYSYEILRELGLLFSAEISLRHHRFQGWKYPKRIPKYEGPMSNETIMKARFCARMLAIADVYVSATNRPAKRYDWKKPLSREEAVAMLKRKFVSQKNIIGEIYAAGIFEAKNSVRPVQTRRPVMRPARNIIIQHGPGAQIFTRMRRR